MLINVINLLNNNMDKKRWEESEINFLKDNYKEKGLDFCVKELQNRTLKSVDRKISRLKLKKRSEVWRENEINFLKDNYSIRGSLYCAEHLSHRSLESVRIKANKLGLNRDLEKRYNRVIAPLGYKYCPSCDQILTESSFYKKNGVGEYDENKHYPTCRACARESARRCYRNHKSSNVENYKKNPIKKMFQNLKGRAKRENILFNLDMEDIVIPEICPVLGIPLIPFSSSDNSPSVDKFNPELGYVKGNIYIISKKANRIKCDATVEEVEKILIWMKSKS